jgi:CheY-like chemotaxis protein
VYHAEQMILVELTHPCPKNPNYHNEKTDRIASTSPRVLIGYGQKGDKERALAAGFYAHLTKPASMKKIESLLQKISDGLGKTDASGT